MALLSVIGDGSSKATESVSLTITSQELLILISIISSIVMLFLISWLVINYLSVIDEKKRYYKNLNKKLEKENK